MLGRPLRSFTQTTPQADSYSPDTPLVASGLAESTYIGTNGLFGRSDLAGLNLAQYPAILIELGNMRNADEAAQMEGAEGRSKYAAAVTQGFVAYLRGSQT